MTDISEMTNEELDMALAVEVKGWNLLTNSFGLKEYWGKDGRRISLTMSWHPTTDPGQAIGLLDGIRKHHIVIIESRPDGKSWFASLITWDTPINKWMGESEKLERAVCEAVLAATRQEKEGEDAAVPDAC